MAYKLKLLETARIHPVFHVSLLKQFEGDPSVVIAKNSFALITNEQGPLLQSQVVLQGSGLLRNGQILKQVLVKWHGLSHEDNSWEDFQLMKQHYPSLDLKDKAVLHGRSNVIELEKRAPWMRGFKRPHVWDEWEANSSGKSTLKQ